MRETRRGGTGSHERILSWLRLSASSQTTQVTRMQHGALSILLPPPLPPFHFALSSVRAEGWASLSSHLSDRCDENWIERGRGKDGNAITGRVRVSSNPHRPAHSVGCCDATHEGKHTVGARERSRCSCRLLCAAAAQKQRSLQAGVSTTRDGAGKGISDGARHLIQEKEALF